MLEKTIRDLAIRSLLLLPFRARVWLQERGTRPLLWLLFRLERARVTIAPVGPRFCRYRMWLDWQTSTIMVLGAYEPEVTEVLRREIRPGNICIDVGAHVGYYAILMARLAGQKGVVVAFEPVPVNFEMLQSNIALNALENVRLEPLAVSEGAGGLSLILRSDTELTMNASASGYGVEDRRKVLQVATCSLDGYLARTGIIPDLLLIDVEGAELDVLKGAQATLSKAPPNLLIEIHGWHGPEHDEVSRFLSSFGYQGTILGQRGGEAFAFFRSSNQVMGTPAQEAHSEGSAVSA